MFAPDQAAGPFVVSLVLYGAWVWGSAFWLLRYSPPVRLLVSGAAGGFARGLAMAGLAMVLATGRDGFWAPLRGITSVALGDQHFGGGFAAGDVLAGAAGHVMNSVAVGVLFAFVAGTFLARSGFRSVTLAGAAFGLVVWAVMVPDVANALQDSDLFVDSVPQWGWILGHVLFGGVTGLAIALGRRR